MEPNNTQKVSISVADPSALGLFGLALITLVASTQKLGWTSGVSYVLPWAIFLGALAQIFACFSDSKHNNVFGTTAFGAYGLFWLGVAMTWLIKNGAFGPNLIKDMDTRQFGVAFLGYLIFSLYMTIASMETHKVLFIIMCLIDVLFFGLTLSTLNVAPEFTHKLAGWAELGASIFGFYGSAASVLNNHFGKVFLPVGKPFGIFK